ncbi:ionotropic receptor 75a-like [Arctopsyche grandis]|uniref:ionotropic receptor 75a-like n=1 Tax=Arctopsyche grandis TaxID=121162 RepID=UPI00406D9480
MKTIIHLTLIVLFTLYLTSATSPIHKIENFHLNDSTSKFSTDTVTINFSLDYFTQRKINIFVLIVCIAEKDYQQLLKSTQRNLARFSLFNPDHIYLKNATVQVETILNLLKLDHPELGVMIDYNCPGSDIILEQASYLELFNSSFKWVVIDTRQAHIENCTVLNTLKHFNMSVDTDITVAHASTSEDEFYEFVLSDVYNTHFIMNGKFKIQCVGKWNTVEGFNVSFEQSKFIQRRNFEELLVRASIVMSQKSPDQIEGALEDTSFKSGANAMTKHSATLLRLLADYYNFRIKYTIENVWGGIKSDGTQDGMMGSIQRKEVDMGTGIRYLPERITFAHYLTKTWTLRASFVFRDIEEGIGPIQSKFAEPFSHSCWFCCAGVAVVMVITLTIVSFHQNYQQQWVEEETGIIYSILSVIAAFCQQVFLVGPSPLKKSISREEINYDQSDVIQEPRHISARITYLVVFFCSLLVFNYYTSSVVSSLLSPPPKADIQLQDLVSGSLNLIFEDIGYTRALFDNPNFSFKQHLIRLEKQMVAKVKREAANRNLPIYVNPEDGIELVRKGGHAYQTEDETANFLISNTFTRDEICNLRTYTMLECQIFLIIQKNSPFSEAFRIGLLIFIF